MSSGAAKSTLVLSSVVAALVLAGCAGTEEPDDTASSSPPKREPVVTTEDAGDGGALEIVDSGYSVVETVDGRVDVAFAVEVLNTSETDLLEQGNIGLVWQLEGGETATEEWNHVIDLMPGTTTVIGRVMSLTAEPEDMTVEVTDDRWFPSDRLGELEFDGTIAVADVTIEPSSDGAEVSATVTTTGPSSNANCRGEALVVARDADDGLLGAIAVADVTEMFPAREIPIEGAVGQWPAKADAETSDIVVNWTNCLDLSDG
ncbi:hypothetical protein [Stackebrandtia soli]|uniref:hypothetical protein n=1 Tax=Stackebrandtia soli TaxID=1892856 RepID=UPI0039EC9A11